MTVDADVIREHMDTDLGDDAIDRLIADAVAAIDARAGSTAAQTVTVDGRGRYIFLPYPVEEAADIDSISERWGDTDTELDAADWRLIGERQIERLAVGSSDVTWWGDRNFNWTPDVLVTFTPKAEEARRDRVTIDLVRLAMQARGGLTSERAGDYSWTIAGGQDGGEQAERERIISEVVRKVRFA